MTPGTKTSEFWMSLTVMVLGLFFVVWGVVKGDPTLIEKGMMMLTGAAGTYSLARGVAKITATGSDGATPVSAPVDGAGAADVIKNITG